MVKILFLSLAVLSSVHAQSTAVEALKSYIPLYDHQGVNGLGRRCSIDLYHRSGGIMVELMMPRFSKFLVSPEMKFEMAPDRLAIIRPSYPENDGTVTNGLIFEGREVRLERKYCVGEKCWTSGTPCLLDAW